MSRHPLDRQDGASPSRPERFAEIEREKVPGKRHLLTRLVYKSQSRLVLGKPDAELEMVPMAGLSKSTVDCVIAASVDLSTKRI
jgi:hypothetical protein